MLAGLAARAAPVDEPGPADLVPEHDVLGHGQVVAEVDLLVHGADAGVLRLGGTRERAFGPVDHDLSSIDRVDPGQRLDERGLPGAVLAHQGVHLAGEEPEVDAVERLDPGKAEGDPRHRDDRGDVLLVGRNRRAVSNGHHRPFVRTGTTRTGRLNCARGAAHGHAPGAVRIRSGQYCRSGSAAFACSWSNAPSCVTIRGSTVPPSCRVWMIFARSGPSSGLHSTM